MKVKQIPDANREGQPSTRKDGGPGEAQPREVTLSNPVISRFTDAFQGRMRRTAPKEFRKQPRPELADPFEERHPIDKMLRRSSPSSGVSGRNINFGCDTFVGGL